MRLPGVEVALPGPSKIDLNAFRVLPKHSKQGEQTGCGVSKGCGMTVRGHAGVVLQSAGRPTPLLSPECFRSLMGT